MSKNIKLKQIVFSEQTDKGETQYVFNENFLTKKTNETLFKELKKYFPTMEQWQ